MSLSNSTAKRPDTLSKHTLSQKIQGQKSQGQHRGQICVFAKTPELGRVKTRLQADLGTSGCLKLHQWLVRHRIQSLTENFESMLRLYVTESLGHSYWRELTAEFSTPMALQSGESLGDRMGNAVQSSLPGNQWLVLLGADCPELGAGYVQSAVNLLEEGAEVVIGPAHDGGYVLLGLRRYIKEIFQDIDWGTDKVFQQTVAALNSLHQPYKTLAPLRDLDTIDDLAYYRGEFSEIERLLA